MPFVFRKGSSDSGMNPYSSAPPNAPGGLTYQQPQAQPGLQYSETYPERIRKQIALATQYDCQFIPSNEDIREIEFYKYRNVFNNTLVRDLLFLRRVKAPNNKEFLVYKYQETITDDAGELHSYEFFGGYEEERVPTIKRNNLREITDIAFDKVKAVYTIEWSEKAVDEALEAAHNIPSDLAIAYGNDMGAGDPWRGNEMTIWNLEHFKTVDFNTLERLNKEGYNRKDGTGYNEMMKDDEERRKRGASYDEARNLNTQKMEAALKKAKAVQQA